MALAIGLFSHPYETYQKSANFADPKQINLGRSRVQSSQGDTTGERHTWPRSSVDKIVAVKWPSPHPSSKTALPAT
jgi:hypothetical protein